MHYPGDIVPLLLDLSAIPSASTIMVTVLNTADDSAVILASPNVSSAAMSLVAGSDHVYKYLWSTGGLSDGTYIVLVSYMLAGSPVTGRHLTTVQLGDSRILAEVARQADVAKASDTATTALTLQKADYVAPQDDPFVQAIRTKVLSLPTQVASETTLASIISLLTDVRDAELGTWVKDKVNNKLRILRLDGSLLYEFSLYSDNAQDSRLRS